MTPVFQHDCNDCVFQGHFRGHDVYKCLNTFLARYGDDGPEYTSWPAQVFLRLLNDNAPIHIGEHSMPYRDYLFSDMADTASQAILLSLALKGH